MLLFSKISKISKIFGIYRPHGVRAGRAREVPARTPAGLQIPKILEILEIFENSSILGPPFSAQDRNLRNL